jgi:hypothetical protein
MRWLILIFGFYTVINAITGLVSKREYSSVDNKSNLLFMIFCDIQLLTGIISIISNGWLEKMKGGMGNVMKNSYDRFFLIEHGFMMILAWVLVHFGRIAVKKAPAEKKHQKMLLFFGLALLLIIISIPWSFKANVGRPNFRWFN